VLFAHGSGSSRFSPRNRFVAHSLNRGGFATLLIDLLTAEEDEIDQMTRQMRFDIPLLVQRLVDILDWMSADATVRALPVGLFGASTGAAAALIAAAQRPGVVQAVVSRGGRPDLAASVLAQVRAPTLLIVGERDPAVLDLNREALAQLTGERDLVTVPGATHLFEEPGTLEQVAAAATAWFRRHVQRRSQRSSV
ncbi:MAG: dienelactone hydrolase family protein, partial [Armatimonadetes bacterium]|nr:dienelactone hydrolase family protein [Armatimonadota bacterium]